MISAPYKILQMDPQLMETTSSEAVKHGLVTKLKRWRDTYTDAVIRHADGLRLRRSQRLGGGGGGRKGGGGGGGVGGREAAVGADASVQQ